MDSSDTEVVIHQPVGGWCIAKVRPKVSYDHYDEDT